MRLRTLHRRLALAAEVLAVYGRARLLLKRHGLPVALARLRSSGQGAQAPADAATLRRAIELSRATQRTLAIAPWDSRCLMQSLVLTGLLARRGVHTELLIGVRPGEGMPGPREDPFAAHAWIEYLGRPLLPSYQDAFQTLARL